MMRIELVDRERMAGKEIEHPHRVLIPILYCDVSRLSGTVPVCADSNFALSGNRICFVRLLVRPQVSVYIDKHTLE